MYKFIKKGGGMPTLEGCGTSPTRETKHDRIRGALNRLDVAIDGLEILYLEISGESRPPCDPATKEEIPNLMSVLDYTDENVTNQAGRIDTLVGEIRTKLF